MAGRPCLFCAIVAGDEPGHLVLSEKHVVAFLDVRPLFRGHTLLVPRRHVRTLPDLPGELVGPFFGTAQRLERAVVAACGSEGSLVLLNNVVSQSVPHLHVHVVPRTKGDGLRFWLGPRTRYADAQDAEAMAQAVREAYDGCAPAES
ncbi:MAG: HIT family protein [Actinomycetes bacterium]